MSLTNGCKRFLDGYGFLSSSLDSLVKTIVESNNQRLKILKKEKLWEKRIYQILSRK